MQWLFIREAKAEKWTTLMLSNRLFDMKPKTTLRTKVQYFKLLNEEKTKKMTQKYNISR